LIWLELIQAKQESKRLTETLLDFHSNSIGDWNEKVSHAIIIRKEEERKKKKKKPEHLSTMGAI
jgi:hypothetical protein